VVITFNTHLLQALFEIPNILVPLIDILLGLITSVDRHFSQPVHRTATYRFDDTRCCI